MTFHERNDINTLRELAPDCMVLMKRSGDFPIDNGGKIALYGSGVRHTLKGGTGSGDVNSRFFYTVENGFEEKGFEITTRAWLDAYDRLKDKHHEAFMADLNARAEATGLPLAVVSMGVVENEFDYDIPIEGEGDTAVYVLSRISGEGADRKPVSGDFLLTATEIRDIRICAEKYKRFMLVLNTGGIVDLSPIVNDVPNILLLSQLGVTTGLSLCDVIDGTYTPSGKLTDTWATWDDYCKLGDFGQPDDICYREGIYVGYRYFDSSGIKPIFPFGFGLSYTDFEVEADIPSVSGYELEVSANIKNVGCAKGKEVMQLYISKPQGKLNQPYQVLAGYAKTKELAPNEEETVTIVTDLRDLCSYDSERASYILETGNYIVRVGTSSKDTKPVASLHLAEEVLIRKVINAGGETDFTDHIPDRNLVNEKLTELPVIELSAQNLSASFKINDAYGADYQRALKKAEKLSIGELKKLCIGAYGEKRGSLIGDSSTHLAGAAGETYGDIKDIPYLIMADGPAGLRITEEGCYATAIPIGTAIAQSFDPNIVEKYGDIVGDEMEQFGVDLWLAPGMNIHRTPLCGRNFEYYSEDPIVSAVTASAITRGVQKHKGKAVTIKHFAANSQETDRYSSNSVISDRTIREIYLKPFELTIRNAHPIALMTSYNLLNGIHTSERKDLLVDILRKEWGFDGLVMSDWIIPIMRQLQTKYRAALPAASLAAGNNIFMPGSKEDEDDIEAALQGKSEMQLSRKELELNAARIIMTAWKLKGF